MKAKILSYSRSRGAFAGVSLTGTTLHTDEDANKAVYGKPAEAAEILHEKTGASSGKAARERPQQVLTEGCVGACAVRRCDGQFLPRLRVERPVAASR